MHVREYFRVVSKHWLAIVLITGLVFAAVAVYTFLQPKVYTATAQIFVSISTRVQPNQAGQSSVSSSTPYVLQRLTSYVEVVGSPQVMQPVVDQLGLKTTAEGLAGSVSAINPAGTVILEISANDTSPQLAAEIANAVAERFTVVIQDLEAQTLGSSVLVKATMTRPAVPPTSPTSPTTALNLVVGMLVGLALGVGYAFLREALDNTVKSQDQLNEITGTASVGMIMFDPDAKDKPLVALDQRAIRSESFRTIRTNLRYVNVDHRPKVFTITSALPGEGKSTTAVNLAITFAQAGRRVCLAEADLRRPQLDKYLGIDMEVGLTDVLAGDIPLDDALVSWNRGMLTVLPSGRTPPNPSEMLGSRVMRDVLSKLRSTFDIVIIDAPPLLPVSDAAEIANASDGAILIARWGKTTREQLAAAALAVTQADGRILGTIMNFVPVARGRYGYRYDYGYAYGRGYGYGYGYKARESTERTPPAPPSDLTEQLTRNAGAGDGSP
ncbi:MAG: polysaccharide biosynthesis tyrosine autokinase [Actinomycetota bacterium]|nr:polysaccharide biosynthesis tyrosine autokinase [Actinomycetota bacterium]